MIVPGGSCQPQCPGSQYHFLGGERGWGGGEGEGGEEEGGEEGGGYKPFP